MQEIIMSTWHKDVTCTDKYFLPFVFVFVSAHTSASVPQSSAAGSVSWKMKKILFPKEKYFLDVTKHLPPKAFVVIGITVLFFHLFFHPHQIVPSFPPPPSLLHPAAQFAESAFQNETSCDYTNGRWVQDRGGPIYNGTSCSTIKDGQNCMAHGREDNGYLYWRWRPLDCELPPFEPHKFLQLMTHKALAFVGDSMARNQMESLLCMLSTVSLPDLVYQHGEDQRFRKWHFAEHNFSASVYWSPFLVKGVEKSSSGPNHNVLYVDEVDEKWVHEAEQMDVIVISVGHWFLHPAVYHEGRGVLGCHYCPGLNYTEIGFYEPFRKALRAIFKSLGQKMGSSYKGANVILTTFSPHHFEGDWDKFGACPRTSPYQEGEKVLGAMDDEMRKIELEELEKAKAEIGHFGSLKFMALDITKLSWLRPDGHPGPYMHPFPFANGKKSKVQNDCVHWCLPGPIDTWNEILLCMLK